MLIAKAGNLVRTVIDARMNLLFVGRPGLGKTSIVQQAARSANALCYTLTPSISDPTDVKGMPFISSDGTRADFLPFGELASIMDALEKGIKCVVFIDDIGQATLATQASLMPLMDKLRGKVAVIGATNDRSDKANVQGILEPIKSRFSTIVPVETCVEDWATHLLDNTDTYGFSDDTVIDLVSFLRYMPSALHSFEPTLDIVNQPCPRTWIEAGRILELPLDDTDRTIALIGAIGEGTAAAFVAHRTMRASLVSADAVLLNPHKAPIPTQQDALWCVCVALAMACTPQNFDRIDTYTARIFAAGMEDYATLIYRDCMQRCPQIQHTKAFTTMAIGPRGKFMQ